MGRRLSGGDPLLRRKHIGPKGGGWTPEREEEEEGLSSVHSWGGEEAPLQWAGFPTVERRKRVRWAGGLGKIQVAWETVLLFPIQCIHTLKVMLAHIGTVYAYERYVHRRFSPFRQTQLHVSFD